MVPGAGDHNIILLMDEGEELYPDNSGHDDRVHLLGL